MFKVTILGIILITLISLLCIQLPSIVSPFIISFILAYLLNPIVYKLHLRFSIPRAATAILASIAWIILIALGVIYLVPLIYNEAAILVKQIPVYQKYFSEQVIPMLVARVEKIDPEISERLRILANQSMNGILMIFGNAANNLWTYTMATINIIFFIILIPVLLFFLLRDWPIMSKVFFELFPKYSQKFAKKLFADIDNVLGAYLRGEMLLCSILTSYYGLGLGFIGLDFAFLLGLICGFSILLPLVGAVIVITTLFITGYFQFGFSVQLGYIAILYVIGALLENTFLTPKIIGDSIGINPVWIIFAVLMFGYIAGPVGVLIALPSSGVLKVILVHLKRYYQKTDIYNVQP